MIKPSVQELQALGQGYTIVPVYKEILSDVVMIWTYRLREMLPFQERITVP